MLRADYERLAALYGPVLLALLLWVFRQARAPRRAHRSAAVGCLLGLLWAVPALVALQALNQRIPWWTFAPGSPATLRGMPLELLLGWAILWGIVPPLVAERLSIPRTVALLLALDCVFMPLCTASVHLGPHWLVGEALALAVVLLPALCLAEWTRRGTQLKPRAALQVATAAALFLYLVPETIFAVRPGVGWQRLLSMPAWQRQLWLAALFALAIPGLSAVMEFAQRGLGTPIPYDPPARLVRSGIYRFVANPMQLSCALVMLLWAAALGSGWMAVAAAISIAYGAGIAAWDEGQDLRQRFGDEWLAYRAEVRDWRPRLLPYTLPTDAVVYIARDCGPCNQVRSWLEARQPTGLRILDAETLPPGTIRRMRYVAAAASHEGASYEDASYEDASHEDGIRAFARCLEHLHLGWAWLGAAMRLPGVWQALQLVMDASGLGPRDLCALTPDAPSEL